MRLVLLLSLLCAQPAWAQEDLWKLLQAGGQVVLIRHALTEPGTYVYACPYHADVGMIGMILVEE